MLEKKLAEASRKAKIKRSRFAIVLIASIAVVGMFIAGFIQFDLTIFDSVNTSPTIDPNLAPAALKSKIIPSDKSGESNPPATLTVRDKSLKQPPLEYSKSNGPIDNEQNNNNRPSLDFDNVRRDKFKQALVIFNSKLLPAIEKEGFSAWNAAIRDEIIAKRDEAVSEFVTGKYEAALSKLTDTSERANKDLLAHEDELRRSIDSAEKAFQDDNYEVALTSVENALRLGPENDEVAALKTKISHLPEVLLLSEQAERARGENNLIGEEEFLRRLLILDPSRTILKKRYDNVASILSEEKFLRLIEEGMENINQRQLSNAQNNLQMASRIFSLRDEVTLLTDQVASLKQELDAELQINKGLAASAKDDWPAATRYFDEAKKIHPNSKDALDGLRLSNTIIRLQNETAQYLSAPHRLSSENVAVTARELLSKTKVFRTFSKLLGEKSDQLTELLRAYSRHISIIVISDGLTEVSVRGVGKIGKTDLRTIELKPGIYFFEGRRNGFRSKIVKVNVTPGNSSETVEIICDERV
jgi:tetratricopeptide (TPR) repeat protein